MEEGGARAWDGKYLGEACADVLKVHAADTAGADDANDDGLHHVCTKQAGKRKTLYLFLAKKICDFQKKLINSNTIVVLKNTSL